MIYSSDEKWMKVALKLACHAEKKGEIPIGAVLILKERIIGLGWNSAIATHDPTAHAEIMAIRNAGQTINNYRIPNSTLYVTLQPCIMCAGAIIQSRIPRLVFGTASNKIDDQKNIENIFFNIKKRSRFNIKKNVMNKQCSDILMNFFQKKRKK